MTRDPMTEFPEPKSVQAGQLAVAYHTIGPYRRLILPGVGHNPPQEAPEVFADALLSLVTT